MNMNASFRSTNEHRVTTHLDFIANFESFIFSHEIFKLFGQMNVMTNVVLQSGNSIISQDEPEQKKADYPW